MVVVVLEVVVLNPLVEVVVRDVVVVVVVGVKPPKYAEMDWMFAVVNARKEDVFMLGQAEAGLPLMEF